MELTVEYLAVSDGTGDAALMHITASRPVASTLIQVDNVVGVPSRFIATSGKIGSDGFMDPSTMTNFFGRLNGSNLEIEGFLPGSVDKGNQEEEVVVIKPNTFWANKVAEILTKYHSDDVILKVGDTQPAPDPSGSTIVWFEPI